MRTRDRDVDGGRELQPKTSRIECDDADLMYRAAVAGRTAVLGPAGLLGLQRVVGNAAVGALVTSRARQTTTGSDAVGLPSNTQHQTATVSPALTTLQRTANRYFPEAPLKPFPEVQLKQAPEVQLKPTSKCPDGFALKRRASWLRCDETKGTRNSGCAFCDNGEQESNCEDILKLLGNHRVIAPTEGKCGSTFKITTPRSGAPVIDVVKAEIPGGDTELDINQEVIKDLDLPVKRGRYDVCLKGPIGHDGRFVIAGGSACRKKKKQSKKQRVK